jgi:cysteine desulfurase / selenocysteine lyase
LAKQNMVNNFYSANQFFNLTIKDSIEMTKLSSEDIKRFRAETCGVAERIHFNNAGSSLPPDIVLETVINYLREEARFGGYETEYKYREELENTYQLVGNLINAGKEEVALVENASMAWGIAFNGILFKKGDVVLTSELEYITNLIGFQNMQHRNGVILKVIPNDDKGIFSLQALEEAITPQTRLIAITHIASSTGGILPIKQIGEIARHHQILYLVDACQSAGQLPLDVKEIKCDMLSVTGRKYLRAPRGTGFLYLRREIQDRLTPFFMDGHSIQSINREEYVIRDDARRFELYEKNRALTLGLGKAIAYALEIGLDRIWQRIKELASLMRQKLESIKGIAVHDSGDEKCGIVTFTLEGFDSSFIKDILAEKQINVSIGLARSTLIYMDKNHLSSVIRASVHYYNSEEEIDLMCMVLESQLNKY